MNSEGGDTGRTVLVVTDTAARVAAELSRQSPSLSAIPVEASSKPSDILDRLSGVDCLVIDPVATGFDTVEMVREYDSLLPILLFTARDPGSFAAAAIRADVTDYVAATSEDAYATLLDSIETATIRYDRESATRKTTRMQPLAAFTSDLHACTDELEAIEMAADAATEILAFDRCTFGVERDEMLHVVEERGDDHGDRQVLPNDEGIAGLTYQSGEPLLIDDISSYPRTEGGNEVALLSVPIGDHGVFQAVGDDIGVFTTEDHEAAVLLCDHLTETLSRIERENDLAEQERFFREVLNSIPDPLYILDDSLRFDTVNDALVEAVPYDRDELTELSAAEMPTETAGIDMSERLTRLLEEGGAFRSEIEIGGPDDSVPYQLNTRRIVHDGEPMLLGVARDVTERKTREEELRRQNERLDEFASVMSHDLRTPLNVASGRIELAKETGELSHLDTAEDALGRMTTLIEDALTLARDGRTVESPSPVALTPLVETAWRGIVAGDATLSAPDEAVTVLADKPRLQRCLENVLRNAVEHGNEPHIDVSVTATDGHATLSICDDGPGISADRREDVLQSGYTTSNEGSGLGLGIVARIAEAHGWTITLSDSDAGGLCLELSDIQLAD